MKNLIKLIVLSSSLIIAAPSFAGADCTSEAKEKWMPKSEMQKKILEMGYTIERFKIDGNCYEIYGRTADNKKVEAYFNPVTGEVVKQEVKS